MCSQLFGNNEYQKLMLEHLNSECLEISLGLCSETSRKWMSPYVSQSAYLSYYARTQNLVKTMKYVQILSSNTNRQLSTRFVIFRCHLRRIAATTRSQKDLIFHAQYMDPQKPLWDLCNKSLFVPLNNVIHTKI